MLSRNSNISKFSCLIIFSTFQQVIGGDVLLRVDQASSSIAPRDSWYDSASGPLSTYWVTTDPHDHDEIDTAVSCCHLQDQNFLKSYEKCRGAHLVTETMNTFVVNNIVFTAPRLLQNRRFMDWTARAFNGKENFKWADGLDGPNSERDLTWTPTMSSSFDPTQSRPCIYMRRSSGSGSEGGYWRGTECDVDKRTICEVYVDLACEIPDLCKNGGTCVDQANIGEYMCTCMTGFTGDNCEIGTDYVSVCKHVGGLDNGLTGNDQIAACNALVVPDGGISRLAWLTTAALHDYVYSMMGGDQYFIGLHCFPALGTCGNGGSVSLPTTPYYWSQDGSTADLSMSIPAYKGNGFSNDGGSNEQCYRVQADGDWNNRDCTDNINYYACCEIRLPQCEPASIQFGLLNKPLADVTYTLQDGTITDDSQGYLPYSAVATIKCETGNVLTTDDTATSYTVTCESSDIWSPAQDCMPSPIPTCSSLFISFGSKTIPILTPFTVNENENYTIVCETGHTVERGSVLTDELEYDVTCVGQDLWDTTMNLGLNCKQNPCLNYCENNATCINKGFEATCECQSGWAGDTCTMDLDECASSPCLNKGGCVQLPFDGYQCVCLQAFTGDTCLEQVGTCGLQTSSEQATRTTSMMIQTISSSSMIIGLSFILIIFVIMRDFTIARVYHMVQEISLLLAHSMLVWGRTTTVFDSAALCDAEEDPEFQAVELSPFVCKLVAIVLHYAYLVHFTALMIEALHNYVLYTMVLTSAFYTLMIPSYLGVSCCFQLPINTSFADSNILKKYQLLIVAIVIPLIPVVLTAIPLHDDYTNETTCWLDFGTGNAVIELAPLCVMAALTVIISEATSMRKFNLNSTANQLHRASSITNSRGTLLLAPLTLSAWIIGRVRFFSLLLHDGGDHQHHRVDRHIHVPHGRQCKGKGDGQEAVLLLLQVITISYILYRGTN